ncbi:hypothetical protein KPL70_012694 [Citrus sinensis]|nr:hypothetical protein KPL70_012694 [Citrus sinensis]
MEPCISGYKSDHFIKRSGFDKSFRVEAEGFSGGIWVLWKDIFQVEIVASHSQFVHLRISNNNNVLSWLTAIYASPNPGLRKYLWSELDNLAQTVYGPWILGGDFNTILYDSEKKGGSPTGTGACTLFQSWFNLHNMHDLQFHGPGFTWSRGSLLKCLDRVICNSEWACTFSNSSVLHLPKLNSDYRPILVRSTDLSSRVLSSRPFRFQAAWLTNEGFKDFVSEYWDQNLHYLDAANKFRLKCVEDAEIQQTIFGMHPLKAPGPDGLHAIFYQTQWNTVGSPLCRLVKVVFHDKYLPLGLNSTLIALIPKTESPSSLKIFVPGRHITENIVIAKEVVHSMRKKTGSTGFMAIKVDLEKAYDHLSWEFISDTLREARIPSDLIQVIMACITSVTMRVLWNGEATDEFSPSQGIRQGCPLSPYLFVLCIERLSHGIHNAISYS